MGQKVNPNGFRLGVSTYWDSKWYADKAQFKEYLTQDLMIRKFARSKLAHASVSKIQIHRDLDSISITINSSRPGVVIGKKGEDIEKLKNQVEKLIANSIDSHGITGKKKIVKIQIEEIKKPELDSNLVASGIAQQLEKRIMFRKAMKRAISATMRMGALGIKVRIAGRLNGAEIARSEWNRQGRIPLHTLRAHIDYGTASAKTVYGIIGIKVWIYTGDILNIPKTTDALNEGAAT